MPCIEIKIIEGELSDEETKGLISDVTDVLVSYLGENMRNYIWVIVQEIKDGRFGAGGQACCLQDIRAIQAATPEK